MLTFLGVTPLIQLALIAAFFIPVVGPIISGLGFFSFLIAGGTGVGAGILYYFFSKPPPDKIESPASEVAQPEKPVTQTPAPASTYDETSQKLEKAKDANLTIALSAMIDYLDKNPNPNAPKKQMTLPELMEKLTTILNGYSAEELINKYLALGNPAQVKEFAENVVAHIKNETTREECKNLENLENLVNEANRLPKESLNPLDSGTGDVVTQESLPENEASSKNANQGVYESGYNPRTGVSVTS
ncbi:MAG: hypothetical protein WBE18_05110 [Gammaproteobacteria bacterium]